MRKIFVVVLLVVFVGLLIGKPADKLDFYKFRWGSDKSNYMSLAAGVSGIIKGVLFTHSLRYSTHDFLGKKSDIYLKFSTNDLLIGGGYCIYFKKIYASQYSNAAFTLMTKKYGTSKKHGKYVKCFSWKKDNRTKIILIAIWDRLIILFESTVKREDLVKDAQKLRAKYLNTVNTTKL